MKRSISKANLVYVALSTKVTRNTYNMCVSPSYFTTLSLKF
jgi:hypothetical protein